MDKFNEGNSSSSTGALLYACPLFMRKNRHIFLLYGVLVSKTLITILLLVVLGCFTPTSPFAQPIGEYAEMTRLEQQADDLASQNDPEGAALAIGKAAMMADRLMEVAQEPAEKKLLQAASFLYRGQELGLRALALFELTGGNPPAPDGVCHYLAQGYKKMGDSRNFLQPFIATSSEGLTVRRKFLLEKNENWQNIMAGLVEEFQCPAT